MRTAFQPLPLVRSPTPVERIAAAPGDHGELWVKRDDLTHEVYGGNKVRKLAWLLAEARARGARRIFTLGAVGSHHVLATTYFGAREGFAVEAVLVPQPRTEHAVEVLRAGIRLGLDARPVQSWAGAVPVVLWRLAADAVEGNGVRFVPLGGSSAVGTMGYVTAARELAAQVRAGDAPEPDVCVVALGSGGTAAGLAAGFEAEGMKTCVVGVCVSAPSWALAAGARRLARLAAERIGARAAGAEQRLRIDSRFLGKGYGHRAPEGGQAARAARQAGLELDPTYTEKAFASALWHLRAPPGRAPEAREARVVLYWHTLSSAPMGPLLEGAPSEQSLGSGLSRLLV